MRFVLSVLGTLMVVACGGGQPAAAPDAESGAESSAGGDAPSADSPASAAANEEGASNSAPAANGTEPAAGTEVETTDGSEFALRKSDTAKSAHGATASKIKPTKTEAAMKFIVVDKDKGPIKGVVISLAGPDGKKFFTQETDTAGYSEVLVPVGQKYSLVYLSLGQGDLGASVVVTDEPNQNIKMTLRYKNHNPEAEAAPRFVLDGVNFDTGKATIRAESFARLDSVVEYMSHKPSARIEISGHTDNVGNPKTNKSLSEKRAQACRAYLVNKGIDESRVQAVGVGDERPIAPNDTDAGRQQNRRIEATEL